jgi:uncharacterized protein YjiS (DUF1127 family)
LIRIKAQGRAAAHSGPIQPQEGPTMFERFHKMIDRWRDQAWLENLDERDLADLGVTRDQALHLARLPADVPGRMQAMAAIFGLDAATLQQDRPALAEMSENCATCGETRACRRTLDRARVLDGSVSAADCGFCPNAGSFRIMAGQAC